MERTDLAVECIGLRRTFVLGGLLRRRGEVEALRGVSLEIPQGQVFGLLGPNGAGKTTTVRILATLLHPTAGEARVLGHDVVRQSREVRRRIGLALGGDRGLFGRITAHENLRYFAAINHLSPAEAARRSDELLELVDLRDRADERVMGFSRGMRQRLHLARALLTDPEVIFLDEPTSGLDPLGARDFRQLVQRLEEMGRTVLLTTHYMLEADQLCKQIAVINHGEVIAAGTPAEIKRRFGQAVVVELRLKEARDSLEEVLSAVPGVLRTEVGSDGFFQTVSVQLRPDADQRAVSAAIGEDSIESLQTRTASLEEAYLALVEGAGPEGKEPTSARTT